MRENVSDAINISKKMVDNHLIKIGYVNQCEVESTAIDGDRVYESRLYVWFPSSAIWKRSFFKESFKESLETRLGFYIKMWKCIN